MKKKIIAEIDRQVNILDMARSEAKREMWNYEATMYTHQIKALDRLKKNILKIK